LDRRSSVYPLLNPYDGKQVGTYGKDNVKAHSGIAYFRATDGYPDIIQGASGIISKLDTTGSNGNRVTSEIVLSQISALKISFGEGAETNSVFLSVARYIVY
jgi:hypothetical protein